MPPKLTGCPTCGETILRTKGGHLLQPQPHWSGIYHPEGRKLRGSEIHESCRHGGTPIGHHPHECPPQPQPPDQLTIFEEL